MTSVRRPAHGAPTELACRRARPPDRPDRGRCHGWTGRWTTSGSPGSAARSHRGPPRSWRSTRIDLRRARGAGRGHRGSLGLRQEHPAAADRRACCRPTRAPSRVGDRVVSRPRPARRARVPGAAAAALADAPSTTSPIPLELAGRPRRRARGTCPRADGAAWASPGSRRPCPAQLSGGMAQRVGARPGAHPGAAGAAARRAVRRPRRADARPARRRAAGDSGSGWARPSSSSPTASRRRSSWPTGWWCSRQRPGRVVADVPVELPRPRRWADLDARRPGRAALAVRAALEANAPDGSRTPTPRGRGSRRSGRLMRDVLAVIAPGRPAAARLAGRRVGRRLPAVRAAGAARGRPALAAGDRGRHPRSRTS